jgi:hypothetical protein
MELTLLDSNLIATNQIDVFSSLIWTDKYCGYGDFELAGDITIPIVNARAEDLFLKLDESEHVMIVEGVRVLSNVETGVQLITKGRSLESILTRRVIATQTILAGSLQDGIELLLTENAIAPSVSWRTISRLFFEPSTDPAITGLTLDAQFLGENLYTAIKEICFAAQIGFKITLTDAGNFKFELYAGVDRSTSQMDYPHVIFSKDYDNLLNSEYSDDKQKFKNVSLVAGEGDGADRMLTWAYSPAIPGLDLEYADLSRRETFSDGGSISKTVDGGTLSDPEYLAQLDQLGCNDLTEMEFVKKFEGEVDFSANFVYETDFFMGDIVQIEDEYGHATQSRIAEVIHSQDSTGTRVYPTFSSVV